RGPSCLRRHLTCRYCRIRSASFRWEATFMDWTAVGAIGQILAAVATYMTIAQMREERHEAVLPVLDVVNVSLTNELDERGRLRFNPDKADCSLNVRVRNNGLGVARNVKLGSRCDRK